MTTKLSFFFFLISAVFSMENEIDQENLLEMKRELDERAHDLQEQEERFLKLMKFDTEKVLALEEKLHVKEKNLQKRVENVLAREDRLASDEESLWLQERYLNQMQVNLYEWEKRLSAQKKSIRSKKANMGECENSKEMKLTGPLKLYPNTKSSIKVFRDRETHAISWEDENNLVPKKMKGKIQYSLQQTGEAMSNGLFDSISDSFWNVPPEARPFFKELMLPISTNVSVERRGELKTTPLMMAAKLDSEKAVFILIGRAAKLEAVDDYHWTALHWAAWEKCESACEVLLSKGADVNAQNVDGNTILMMAAQNGEAELVRLFLKYDADTKIQDNHANTASQFATQNCAEIIEAHQRKTEAVEDDGYSDLHWAAAFGNESTCKKLLRMGSNVLAEDKYGNSPLMIACHNNYAGVVKLLLKSRADVKATNKWGKTALDYATEKCADIIRAHEAKLKN